MTNKKRKQPVRHPWDEWLKQGTFLLRKSHHFQCSMHSMNVQIRTAAASRNLNVSVHVSGPTTLSVTVSQKGKSSAKSKKTK